jgi:hypothetical protein
MPLLKPLKTSWTPRIHDNDACEHTLTSSSTGFLAYAVTRLVVLMFSLTAFSVPAVVGAAFVTLGVAAALAASR